MSDEPMHVGEQFPEGDRLKSFIDRRKKSGLIWRLIFQASTIIAIIALVSLLYNIIVGAFGYVAVQNKVDPASLVLAVEEERMLSASNTFSGEDDNELVAGIEANPNAIGFFGYAYYIENSAKLRAVTIDGTLPSAETAESGEYPYARPLFIYSAPDILESKPQVAAFTNFYLSQVNDVIAETGYFPLSEETLAEAKQNLLAALGQDPAGALPPVNPAELGEEPITISGSSTVYPITRHMAVQFRRAGFAGPLDLEQTGTSAGFRLFCNGEIDLANASRPITRAELETCQEKRLEPVEFRVGSDALAIVVSSENRFLQNVSLDELRQIFTTAENWTEVNPDWPDTPIERFIPGADSGTLDFFSETTFARRLDDLPKETLLAILENNVSTGLVRRFEAEKPMAERTTGEVLDLVKERVVERRVVRSWTLVESIFNRADIEAEVAEIPQAELEFRSWFVPKFLTTPQASVPEFAGIRTAIFGSLWTIFITIVIALPLGVGGAIYLEEYAAMVGNPTLRRINAIIQTNINNLAGVPSIIYGMLGLAIFVRAWEPLTSGTLFGLADPTTANGRTILSAGLTLALLILPLIIINAQEAIRAVPQSLRQAGMGLGATKWQTIWSHVLPNAIPGILTGNILAVSRAIGESAPLVVVGASTFITVDPASPFSKFTTLPIQIYQWTSRPQAEFRNIAAAAIIVLLILLLSLNGTAIYLRNRFSRRLS
jgi:phosphate transport system permease protein